MRIIGFLLLFAISFVSTARSQDWERIPVFDYAIVRDLVETNDGTLIAGTIRNLFQSTDRGESWHLLHLQAYDPQLDKDGNVYATSNNRMVRSIDGGATFHYITDEAEGLFLVDPASTSFYKAVENTLVRSDDGGDIWMSVISGIVFPMIEKNGDVIAVRRGKVMAAHDSIFHSTDKGETWQSFAGPDSIKVQRVHSAGNNRYYFLADSSLYHTSDAGKNWKRSRPEGLRYKSVAFLASMDTLYLRGVEGEFRSTDNGDTWSSFPLPTQDIFLTPSGQLWARGSYKFLRFESDQWVDRTKGMYGVSISDIALSSNDTVLALTDDGVIAMGQRLTGMPEIERPTEYVWEIHTGKKGIYIYKNNTTYRSTDGAHTWDTLPHFTGRVEFGSTIGNSGFSTDDGETWQEMILPPVSRSASLHAVPGGVLVYHTDDSLFVSSDSGKTWQGWINQLGNDFRTTDAATASFWIVRTSEAFHTTEDAGRTWHTQSLPWNNVPWVTNVVSDGYHNHVMGANNVLYQWSYDEDRWIAFDSSGEKSLVTLEYHPSGALLMGTGGQGFYSRPYPPALPKSSVLPDLPRQEVVTTVTEDGILNISTYEATTARVFDLTGRELVTIAHPDTIDLTSYQTQVILVLLESTQQSTLLRVLVR